VQSVVGGDQCKEIAPVSGGLGVCGVFGVEAGGGCAGGFPLWRAAAIAEETFSAAGAGFGGSFEGIQDSGGEADL